MLKPYIYEHWYGWGKLAQQKRGKLAQCQLAPHYYLYTLRFQIMFELG